MGLDLCAKFDNFFYAREVRFKKKRKKMKRRK